MADSDLTVITEELPGSQVGLTIEVPQTTVDATYDRVLNRLVRRVKVEGFRPGKAPRALVEARLGHDAVREEVIEALVPEVLGQALEEHQLEPLGRPRVDVLELERGRPGKLSATIAVMPDVELPELDGLHVERHTTEVTEEMVERRIEALREAFAEVEPVDREARPGDIVIADIDVEVEGKRLEAQSRRAAELEVKEGSLIPEIREALLGKHTGEQSTADVTLPEENPDPELAGKQARFLLTLQGVKEKRLPPLDDELAAKLSDGKYNTATELQAGVREDLEEQARRMDALAFEQTVLKELVEHSTVEIPPPLVEAEAERELSDLERRLTRQGVRLDRYLSYQDLSREQWLEQAKPDAEARLKVDLVLEQLAKREGIEPTDAEVDEYIEREAARDEQLKNQVALLKESASTRRYFHNRLQRVRTLDRLVELVGAQTAVTG